ncbi:Adaptin ear-binding coat-associated protein 1 [Sarcoptes scabiei]|uniref:Adaptin ear-binding coat-associated protein 1 n=1 Tax=Sarcoptes scabiei TaxID=52283 RepID=A0A131ZZP8_SARSC|nr:Adaptin ear-binding coat-associated protein 1 [Sarcoptes scabiei]KPM04137.1 DUF1681 domain containing protein [Sarcoptes scabiei]
MDDYERVLLVKTDVQVYKIPPRNSNRAYRASDWNLDSPDWTCRLRLISKGDDCYIKLEEKSTGHFFGLCPIDKYPGPAVEPVADSSRYFVLRLVNESNNRNAFIGIGFADRGDSFDLNVTLQDHFKVSKQNYDVAEEPKLDLSFKEGETINVKLNILSKSKPRPKSNKDVGSNQKGILLPPPPGPSLKSTNPLNLKIAETINPVCQQLFDELEESEGKDHEESEDEKLSKAARENPELAKWISFLENTTENKKCDNKLNSEVNVPNENHNQDNDLWSDFESFNISSKTNHNNNNNFTESKQDHQVSATSKDDWAKFS